MKNKPIIELRDISKNFGDQQVLRGINLDIYENEFLTLLGPSGCGKTTILRIIAGFEEPSNGQVLFNGENIAKLPPYKREVNTVFQKYALFPFLNVRDNVAFGLKLKGLDDDIISQRVDKMLSMVGLKGYEKRDVTRLSGGQQQRVAIARALINEPKVLLLDEPLGALDAKLRKGMQIELKKIQKEVGITFVFVTHDQEEALSMSDTIVVINDGIIQQVGSPMDIYNEPEKRFVAEFIGESNIIEGNMIRDCLVKFDDIEWECVDKGFKPNEEIEVVLRPEDMDVVDVDQAKLTGTIVSKVFMGVHYEYFVETSYRKYKVHTTESYEVGKEIGLTIDPYDIQVMHIS
ncbi:MAG: ABC transporter ATP-binding protein [Clostridiales bacterium]|nr:ABC transporter ATP-binding protein [Clostridiales bacterium]MDY4959053.1 spermidine/putrescine ABC transporter ATP-binding protein [Lentihominibacter sp.]